MRISIEYHAKWSITHSSRLYQKLALNFVVNHQPSHGQIKNLAFLREMTRKIHLGRELRMPIYVSKTSFRTVPACAKFVHLKPFPQKNLISKKQTTNTDAKINCTNKTDSTPHKEELELCVYYIYIYIHISLEVQPPCFKGYFQNYHCFSRGLSSSERNHHFQNGG